MTHPRISSCRPGLLIASGVFGLLLVAASGADAAQHGTQKRHAHTARKPAPPAVVDQQMLATQVMLDRAGFSPGEIDAVHGTSTDRALAAYKNNGGNADALPADPLTDYTITEQDAAGPFTPSIPSDMMEMSKLPALGYTSILEMLGERLHASPALLKRLNPAATFAGGETIRVPNVSSQNEGTNAAVTAVTVTVRKSTSDLTVTDATGRILMYAPVTTGSEHDPLPIGEWKVNGVQRDPTFHYNPALFWDAERGHAKASIPSGPNNPVGVVWVDISRPHYGLHGTPEPSKIGKTESHGCVRLTNWDAVKLASLVRPGTRVVFAE
jgi:lipoprotein-anchoring transpeptidase ErfK/SrfK